MTVVRGVFAWYAVRWDLLVLAVGWRRRLLAVGYFQNNQDFLVFV